MCETCEPFNLHITLESSQQLEDLHTHLYFNGVKMSALEIIEGSLQFDDDMHCILRCAVCCQSFELIRGYNFGSFKSVPRPVNRRNPDPDGSPESN